MQDATHPSLDSSRDSLGNVLLERRGSFSLALITCLYSVPATILGAAGAVMIPWKHGIGDLRDLGLIAFSLAICVTGAFITRFALDQCSLMRVHEGGVSKRSWGRTRSLLFRDIDGFWCDGSHHYSHGAYTGPSYSLHFYPVWEIGERPLKVELPSFLWNASERRPDQDLESFCGWMHQMLCERMRQQLQAGQPVDWLERLRFLPEWLEYRRKEGYRLREEVYPYASIRTVELVGQRNLRIFIDVDSEPQISVKTARQPNDVSGLMLLEWLIGCSKGEPAGAARPPLDDHELGTGFADEEEHVRPYIPRDTSVPFVAQRAPGEVEEAEEIIRNEGIFSWSTPERPPRPLTDKMIADAENVLGVKLPASLLAILRMQNGGCPQRREYHPDYVELHEVYGIAPGCTTCSALQEMPRRIWDVFEGYFDDAAYEEWRHTFQDTIHPDWGRKPRIPETILLLEDRVHWGIALHYVRCGRQGEPSVVHVEMEGSATGDQIFTEIAPDFLAFLRMLYVHSQEAVQREQDGRAFHDPSQQEDKSLSEAVREQRELAIRRRDRSHRIIFAFIVIGVAGGVATLAFDGTNPALAPVASLVVAVVSGVLLSRLGKKAKCPKCGHKWEIVEIPPNHLLEWTNCPGCDLDTSAGFGTG